jgi:hypothetical protein
MPFGDIDNCYDILDSDLRIYLNTTFLDSIDEPVRNVIKTVKVPYVYYESLSSKVVRSGANGLTCKVFVPSAAEVDGSTKDGANLSYFSSATKRTARYDGIKDAWWTRTIDVTMLSSKVRYVTSSGKISTNGKDQELCVRPTFILPLDIDPDTLTSSTNKVKKTITLHPSSVNTSLTTSTNASNILGKSHENTENPSSIFLLRTSGDYGCLAYNFDYSEIPTDAKILKVEALINCSIDNTSGYNRRFVGFMKNNEYTAVLSKGFSSVTTSQIISISSAGLMFDLTLSDLNSWSLGAFIQQQITSSRPSTTKTLLFYGATVTIEYEVENPTGNSKVDIGGVWKDVSGMKINIDGVWKDTVGIYSNIGGTWNQS